MTRWQRVIREAMFSAGAQGVLLAVLGTSLPVVLAASASVPYILASRWDHDRVSVGETAGLIAVTSLLLSPVALTSATLWVLATGLTTVGLFGARVDLLPAPRNVGGVEEHIRKTAKTRRVGKAARATPSAQFDPLGGLLGPPPEAVAEDPYEGATTQQTDIAPPERIPTVPIERE